MIVYTDSNSEFNLFTFIYNQYGIELSIQYRGLTSIEQSLFSIDTETSYFVFNLDVIQIDKQNSKGSSLESLMNISDSIRLILSRRDELPIITYAVNDNDPDAIALFRKVKVISDC